MTRVVMLGEKGISTVAVVVAVIVLAVAVVVVVVVVNAPNMLRMRVILPLTPWSRREEEGPWQTTAPDRDSHQ